MPDPLAVADWKAKANSQYKKAKEAATLLKPLEAYAKAKGEAAQQKEAIDEVLATIKTIRGKNPDNDDLHEDLDKVKAAAEKAAKDLEKQIELDALKAKALVTKAKAAAPEATFDDELAKQLLVVRNIGADKARHFVLALGKPAGLAISKMPISKVHKQRARKWRKGNGKLLIGTCYGQSGKYVFDFGPAMKPPPGLAALIKKSTLNQAEKNIKVIARGAGQDLDDELDTAELADLGEDTPDDDEAEGTSEEGIEAEAKTGAEAEAKTGADTAESESQEGDPNAEAKARLEARLAEIEGPYTEALQALPDRAGTLRALRAYVGEQAEAGQIAKATTALGRLETAIRDVQAAAKAKAQEKPLPSLVLFQQSRLAWDAARKRAEAELDALVKSMEGECKTAADSAKVAKAVKKLDKLRGFGADLSARLDDALKVPAEQRAAVHAEGTDLLRKYLAFAEKNNLLKRIDANPFRPVAVQKTLVSALKLLGSKLGA